MTSVNHDTDNAVVNPYILKSKIAALDDNEYYRFQIAQTCLYFPNNEEQLQKLCRDANSLTMNDSSELKLIRQRNQSQLARASFEQLKESLQIYVVSKSSWRAKFPKDWTEFGGRDTANSRMGEYRRYIANLMKWGLLHNDDKIKHHFTKYRCPCTGKDFSTSAVFLTYNIAEKYLNQLAQDSTRAQTIRIIVNSLNSLLQMEQKICDYVLGNGVVDMSNLRGNKGNMYVEQARENSRTYSITQACSQSVKGKKHLKQPDPQRLCNDDHAFKDSKLIACNLYFLLRMAAPGYTLPARSPKPPAYARARSRYCFNMLHNALPRGADLRHPNVTCQHLNIYELELRKYEYSHTVCMLLTINVNL